ncbi:MAG: hypothetical protein WEB04_12620 [Dehalococcoidia bacterium]
MNRLWKIVLFAVVGLALGGAAFGIVAAQDSGTPTDPPSATAAPSTGDATTEDVDSDREGLRDEYLAQLAENLGVSQADLEAALTQTALDMVDKAVADGKLTEEEATQIREKINSGEAPLFPGFGHGFHRGFHDGFGAGAKLEEIAAFLGIDVSDVMTGLKDEQSLAQIAEANGKSADELAAFLLESMQARLAEAVANGDITQERADEIIANGQDRIDELINRTGFPGPRGGPGHFRPGFDAPANEEGSTTEPSGIIF